MKLKSIFLMVLYIKVSAQQTSLFNTYNYDLMQVNIAAIGRTCFEANLNYRTQWLGVKETPKLYQLNAAMALGKSNGIGIKVAQQSMGLLKVTNATFGYAYRAKLSETSKLHLGLGLAWQQNQFASNKAIVLDNSDASIGTNQELFRANNFDAEAGALFLGNKLTIGVCALHLYNSNKGLNVTTFKVNPQINAILAYKFNKGKTIEIEPWLVNRYTLNGTNQPEGIVNFKFKQLITIGAGYRLNYGYLAMAGFELDKFKIAYSFDYGTGSTAKNLGSSHQILLGFDLCKNKTKKSEPIVETTPVKQDPVIAKEEPKRMEEPIIVKEVPKPEPIKDAPKAEVYKTSIQDVNKLAESISFGVGKTTLDAVGLKKIDIIAEALKKAPDLKVSIEGRASPDGNKALNDALSLKRAEYVKAELIKRGVNPDNLKGTLGVGSEKAEGSQQNTRTVRFVGTN